MLSLKSAIDNPGIAGDWRMCAESGGGQMSQYNVCPIIIFNSDGSGSTINAAGSPEYFRWTLNGKLLKILYTDDNVNKTFPDTNYTASVKTYSGFLELEIHQIKKNYTSYLKRQSLYKTE